MPLTDWVALGAVTAFAAGVQSATGFGFGIVAVPFYLLILNSLSAVQLVIVVTPVISVAVVPRLWRLVRMDLLRRLVAGTVLGLPLGMLVFHFAGLFWIKIAVAALIIGLALIFFASGRRPAVSRRGRSPGRAAEILLGVLSGTMSAALGMPGPPVMLYFSALNLDRDAVRATLLSLFVLSYIGAAMVQTAAIGISAQTWLLAAAMAPCALAGAALGNRLSRGMSQHVFNNSVRLLLLGTGLYMLYGTLSGG